MSKGRRFSFDDPGFRSEVAHGGPGRIRTSRVFKGGEVIRKVPEAEIVTAMREEVDKFIAERKEKLVGAAAP